MIKITKKINALPLEQLQELVASVGIKFEGGIESIKDRDVSTAKEQLILVLDEVPTEELEKKYTKIIENRNSHSFLKWKK